MRIAIANDTFLVTEFLRRLLASQKHTVAWVAENGAEAVEKCSIDRPDLILMDLVMPVMDGIEATRRIMAETPCPILALTATDTNDRSAVYDTLSAGALDVATLPNMSDDGWDSGVNSLLEKIAVLGRRAAAEQYRQSGADRTAKDDEQSSSTIIAIGASAGGPAAIVRVIQDLPPYIPAAIVVVLHLDVQFAKGMADWVDGLVALPVLIAVEGERPRPGTVAIAATNEHLVLTPEQTFHYTKDPEDNPYRPSSDRFFKSLVENWRGDAVGVILTGMGKDGAAGLKEMRQKGWHTIAQDEASSTIYGMPRAAVLIDAAKEVLPLDRIGAKLARLAGRVPSKS